jgi:hypothetical protein
MRIPCRLLDTDTGHTPNIFSEGADDGGREQRRHVPEQVVGTEPAPRPPSLLRKEGRRGEEGDLGL